MTTQTQAIQKTNNAAMTIRAMLEKSKGQIAAALPKHISPDRLLRVAMTAIQRTPKLLECDPVSLIGAVIQASQLGLEPDGVLGHAYLIPFYNSKKGRSEVQFIAGYKGLIDLARRSGQVISIAAHVVYQNDSFDYAYGLEEKLNHKPSMGERGKSIAVYAVAKLRDGGHHFEVLSVDDVERIRKSSKAGNFGPWVDNWDEMARKTAIRRLAKFLPLSVEFQKASALDELADAGIQSDILSFELEAEIQPEQPVKKNIDDALKAKHEKIVELFPETQEAVIPAEEKLAVKNKEEIVIEIGNLGVTNGLLTAYVIRSLGKNIPIGNWSDADAAKVLEEVKKTKGGNK
jgi:recombination protein RecT